MEAVSALQHARVLRTHVLVADDAGIFRVELQSAGGVMPERTLALPWQALSQMCDCTYG